METAIQTNNNDEINVLRIKLDVVEKELQIAISRAEMAENELDKLKNSYKRNNHLGNIAQLHSSHDTESAESVMICSHCGHSLHISSSSAIVNASNHTITTTACIPTPTQPPPPPPPMPNFKPIPFNLNQSGASLNEALTAFTLNNHREMDDNVSIYSNPDAKKSATGRFYSRTHIILWERTMF